MTRVDTSGFLVSVDPATGLEIARHPEDSEDEIEAKLSSAVEAFAQWRALGVPERGKYLTAVGREILDSSPRLSARYSPRKWESP